MKKIVFILSFITFAFSASFPTLQGRVTDDAGILGEDSKTVLIQKIKEIEKQSDIYLVVATVDSLDGDDIADYGVKLGRHWGIGKKDKNNGVLLLVAPNERRINISTGYGVEGVLTDAISSNIIQEKIIPEFKKDNYEQGVIDGVSAIGLVLSGEYDTMKIMKKYMDNFTIMQTSYPKYRYFSLTNYSPRAVFVTLFVFSFIMLFVSTMFKSAIVFVFAGFSAVYTFIVMILSLALDGILANGANYFLVTIYVIFVGFFTYKNRDYEPI